MEIRKDFESVDPLLYRLIEYAKAFRENNKEHWPHYKNQEDFEKIYSLPQKYRIFDKLYGDGRNIAIFMSNTLCEFNIAWTFPTLKSYVDYFKKTWAYETEALRIESDSYKESFSELEDPPWAVEKMIQLFDKQIDLLVAVKQTIDGLEDTDLYRWESGISKSTYPTPEYQKILECIDSTGKMFQSHPASFSNKDEESLRDHILVSFGSSLGHSTSGETFNNKGKTDILIKKGSSNVFIGECKIWAGKKAFLDSISQLLSYLTWSDTQTALIFFVREKQFSSIIKKVKEDAEEHSNFYQFKGAQGDNWLNYEFVMNDDEERIIRTAIMLYHIPS